MASISNARSAITVTLGKAARWLSRHPAVQRLSRLLPGPLRMLARRQVNDLSRRSALYDLPVRLDLPEAAKRPGPHFRIIVFGAFYSDWNAALVDPAVWQAIPGVVEVQRLLHAAQVAELPPTSAHTVIIPLGEDHIRHCPTGLRSLVPDSGTLETLSDKARFASFMGKAGLSMLCPRIYANREEVEFPCVLKRLDQSGAYGVELVQSAEQLDAQLKRDVFERQHYLLQAFVPGDTEYAFHGVCKDGEILWSCALSREMGSEPRIGGLDHDTVKPITPSERVRSQIATVLARLRYSGPCCVDYKLMPNGDIAMFEINPRFGGSLMIPANREPLRQALGCIIANAR